MKMYLLKIEDRTGKIDYIKSWNCLNIGDTIGWGPDDEAADGIMRWTVKCVTEFDR